MNMWSKQVCLEKLSGVMLIYQHGEGTENVIVRIQKTPGWLENNKKYTFKKQFRSAQGNIESNPYICAK